MLPNPSSSFAGFPTGSRATVIPNAFFSILLPEIADPRELLVTVYAFFALSRKSGSPRCVSEAALEQERPLMKALSRLGANAEMGLRNGLANALTRGTLLVVGRTEAGASLYALNTEAARRVAANRGLLVQPAEVEDSEALATTEQPNIYALYEENIGSLPPLLLDELEEAEGQYPRPWIEAAFREAVANNRRSWRYISRILERWKLEGPDYETFGGPAAVGARDRGRRALGGSYRRIVDRGR
ncbi:MAG TPA: DnaD domain protein [Dehalococcoidia bacterium]|nr:DnaD domain protein [Dehalococcoidia bacterium]